MTRFAQFFKTRDFIFHDGRDLRRFSIAGRTQAALAAAFAVTLVFSAYGVAQAGVSAIALTGLTAKPLSPEAKVASMEAAVADMQTKIQQIRYVADVRAKRVEARQAMLAGLNSFLLLKAKTEVAMAAYLGRGQSFEHFGLNPLISGDVCHKYVSLVLPIRS